MAETPRTLRLDALDNIVVAVDEIPAACAVANGATARERIPRGHKMTISPIGADEPVIKFGQIIGFASRTIAPGEWVHEHNCAMKDFAREYRFGEAAVTQAIVPATLRSRCRARLS